MIDPAIRPETHGRGFTWRMALFFAALFLIYGVHVNYFPVWLADRGLSAQDIGVITALPIFIRVGLTPAIAALADARANHRSVIIAMAVLAALLALLIAQGRTFWPLLALCVPYAIAVSTIMPLTETIAVSGVRLAGHDYGHMRLWGSLTFLLATLMTGRLTDQFGPGTIIAMLAATSAVTAAVSWLLPRPAIDGRYAPPRDKAAPLDASLFVDLLMQPLFLGFLLAIGCIIGSHAAFYTFGALHLRGQGLSGQAFGILWGVSIAAEMAVLAWSRLILARFGPLEIILLAGIAGFLRWGTMSFDPPFAVLLAAQALHGATYGAAHLGAIHFIARAVPGFSAGSAQALYSAVGNGLFTAVATMIAGLLYPRLGGLTFLAMGLLCGVGVGIALWLRKNWDGGPLPDRGGATGH